MKFTTLAVALSVLYGVEATTGSTVTCSSCPESTSTNDVVTRSPVPEVNCTSPPLLVVVNGTTSTPITTPTSTDSVPSDTATPGPSDVPVAGGAKIFGSIGGAAAAALAVVYLI